MGEVIYIRTTEVDTPLMKEMLEAHRIGSRTVYVYYEDGNYSTFCKGLAPDEWDDSFVSFRRVRNILEDGTHYTDKTIFIGGE